MKSRAFKSSINLTGEVVQDLASTPWFIPATHFIADEDRMEGALKQIEQSIWK